MTRPVIARTNGVTPHVVKGALLSVLQAAALLGTDERWVRRRMSCHLLPFRKLNGRIVILRAELDKFIDSLENLPGCSVEEAQANLALRNGEAVRR